DDVALARRSYLPDFDLTFERFYNRVGRDGYGAMIAMTLPLPFKYRRDAALDEAHARLASEEAMRRRAEDRTAAAVKRALAALDQPAELSRAPIRLDAAQQQAIGLTWGTAERRPLEKVIRTVGRLDYDERRLAQVTLKVSGFIEELYANYTGQPVRKGDPLFSLYSPELLTAQREYLLARETERRLRQSSLPEARVSAASLAGASRERLR